MSAETQADETYKTQDLTGSAEGGTDTMPNGGAGEDDGGAPKDGDDSHLTDDQKPKRD